MPVVNLLKHDLLLPHLNRVRALCGIFNSTSNYILSQLQMSENASATMASALREAQEMGIAEADATLDMDGSDAANKLCIVMSICGVALRFEDVARAGLETLSKAQMREAARKGKVCKMVARATRNERAPLGWDVSVRCQEVDKHSFLGRCGDTDLCLQIETDLFDTHFYKTNEKDVVGTSAAVLRDIVNLALDERIYGISKL